LVENEFGATKNKHKKENEGGRRDLHH